MDLSRQAARGDLAAARHDGRRIRRSMRPLHQQKAIRDRRARRPRQGQARQLEKINYDNAVDVDDGAHRQLRDGQPGLRAPLSRGVRREGRRQRRAPAPRSRLRASSFPGSARSARRCSGCVLRVGSTQSARPRTRACPCSASASACRCSRRGRRGRRSFKGLGLIRARIERMTAKSPGDASPTSAGTKCTHDRTQSCFVASLRARTSSSCTAITWSRETRDAVLATTPYCGGIVSAVQQGAVMGVQFHPEKSSQAGFQLIRNFLAN